jgi:hypothetical protein
MKKFLLLLLTLCAFGNDQFAQLIDVWKNGTDMMTYDRKRAYEAPSGNILLARMDDYYGIGDGNDLLRCFDADGALLWSFGEEDFGDDSGSNFIDIAFDSESNTYIAGANFPQTAQYPKTEVIKISPTGEELWRINFTQQTMWAEEVFEIEISEDNRIFLFATLFNADAETIIPHFIEIDTEGETVHFQPDINFDFGQGQMFQPGDGFLYSVDQQRTTKLNYDGTVVWIAEHNFGDGFSPNFGYERTEYLVKFLNGELYAIVRIDDANNTDQFYGLLKISSTGLVATHLFTILPELDELYSVNPLFCELLPNGEICVVGDYVYGDSEPDAGENSPDDRGGKGSSYRGSFIAHLSATNMQTWVLNYPEEDDSANRYPVGTFLDNSRLGVVYIHGNFGVSDQLVEAYQSNDGAVVYTDLEGTNDAYETSNPDGAMLASDGALYTVGSGTNTTDGGNEVGIYLYKYELTPLGLNEKNSKNSAVIYPNPVNNTLNVLTDTYRGSIEVIDVLGKRVLTQTIVSSLTEVNMEQLEAGLYHIRFMDSSYALQSFIKE